MVIVSVTAAGSSVAAYGGVGLRVGDTAEYDVHGNLVSLVYNRMTLRVADISGSIVKIEVKYYANWGSLWRTEKMTGDIYAGEGGIWSYLVAPGLNSGEPLYSGAMMFINETTTRTYNGAVRVVNHLVLLNGTLEMYWDRSTGLMTETIYRLVPRDGSKQDIDVAVPLPNVTTTLISTTAWSEGSTGYDYTFPLVTIGASLALVAAITFTALIVDKKRQRVG